MLNGKQIRNATNASRRLRKNRRRILALLAALGVAAAAPMPMASAATYYWDSNGTGTAGAGATPTGTWGSSVFWSTDSTGANIGAPTLTATTTSVDDVNFSAGTDAVNAYTVGLNSATQNARLVTFKDGTVTLNTGTLSLGVGGGITVASTAVTGATISSSLTISGGQTFNVAGGKTLTLNTGTFTRNAGATLNVLNTGTVTSTMTNLSANDATGIIGNWASFNSGTSTTYAKFSGSTITGLGYTGGADGTTAAASANVVTGAGNLNYTLGANGTLGASASVNTLRYTLAAGGTLATSTSFTTNGIMNVGGGTLTFSGSVTSGTGEMVINAANGGITFSGGLNNNGNLLTVTGSSNVNFNNTANIITGSGGLTINNTGLFNLASNGTVPAHNYSGTTTVNAGYLLFTVQGGANIAGTGNITLNGGIIGTYFGGSLTRAQGSGTSQIQIIGGTSGFSSQGNSGSTFNIGATAQWGSATFNPSVFVLQGGVGQANLNGQLTFSSAIDLNGGQRTISVSGIDLTGTANASGVISNSTGTGGLIKIGSGPLTLSNAANSYNGSTTINAGTLIVGALGAVNANSSIGKGSIAGSAADLVINGGTLRYAGTTATSTNRLFTIGTSGATLDASGTTLGTMGFTGSGSIAFSISTAPASLTLTGTGAITTGAGTFGSILSDSGTGANITSLTKSGTGVWFLTNPSNNYTGVTTITGGALVLSNAAALPGGIGASGGTSNLTFNGGVLGLVATDFTRNLNSAATAAAVTFTGAGGWAAFTNDRSVNLNGGSQITWATASTGFNGKTLILSHSSATNTVDLQNGIDLGTAARTVQTDDGTAALDAKLSGVITGGSGGALTKTGAGVLSLTNANTYTGVTTVSAGVLRLDNATALPGGIGTTGGTSNLTFNGGILGLNTGNFTRNLGTAATTTAATFTGAGGWAAYGADRIVNLNNDSHQIVWATANTGFNGQTLNLSAASATNTVTFQNPLDLGNAVRTLVVNDGSAATDAIVSGNISGTGGGILRQGNGTLWLSGNLSFTSGGLNLNTSGTTILSGTNTYSGDTSFNGGGPIVIFAGMQAVSPNSTIKANINASTGTSQISLLDDTGGTNGGTATANTTFQISNNNTPGNAHTFIVGNNNTANGGTSSGTTVNSTIIIPTLNWGTEAPSTVHFGPIQIQGTNGYRLQINNVTLYNAGIQGVGTNTDTVFTPTTANVTLGTVTMATGNAGQGIPFLVLDGTSSDNRITGAITNATDALTTGRPLNLTKSNTSIWTLSGTGSNYSGATTISGGTLAGIGANAFGSTSGISIAAAGTLSLLGDSNTSFVKASDSSLYSMSTSASGVTFNVNQATIAGTALKTMTIGALGTTSTANVYQLNFTGANNTSLTLGAVTGPANNSATTPATVTFNNAIASTGILTLGSYTSTNVGTAAGAAETVIFNGTGATVVAGAITPSANPLSLTYSGSGSLTLSGTSSYTGVTTVSTGTLIVGANAPSAANGALGNASSEVVLGTNGGNTDTSILIGGAFNVGRIIRIPTNNNSDAGTRILTLGGSTAANSTFSGNIFLGTTNQAGRGVTLTAANGGQVTFSGVIQNPTGMDATTYTITKAGLGTVVLSNTNTYTGATSVTNGVLSISSAGSINATSGLTISGGSVFNYNSSTAYSGGAITFTAGTISGTGTIGRAVTAGANTFINPGNSSPGIQTSTQTYTAGLNLSVGGTYIWQLGSYGTTPGTNSDQIITNTAGNLVLGGTSTLTLAFVDSASAPNFTDSFWNSSHTWTIVDANGSISGFGGNPGSTLFTNITNNTFARGNFAQSVSNGDILLTYTINDTSIFSPSPTTLHLAGHFLRGQSASISGSATLQNTGTTSGTYTTTPTGVTVTTNPTGGAAAGAFVSGGIALATTGVFSTPGTNVTVGSVTITPSSGVSNNTTITVTADVGNATALRTNSIASYTANPANWGGPLTALVAAAGSYADLESTVTTPLGAGSPGESVLGTVATIRAGTNTTGSAETVVMAWRSRSSTLAGEASLLVSDVVDLTGIDTPTNHPVFVLQMSYLDATNDGYEDVHGFGETTLFLGYLNSNGVWVNAILGDHGTNTGAHYFSAWDDISGANSTMVLGSWGIDVINNVVWAVVDHNSEFAVIPEPLALPGGLMLLSIVGVISRRRRA